MVFKVKLSCQPSYLFNIHNDWIYPYRTRQADSNLIRLGIPQTTKAKLGYRWRAGESFNLLPEDIRTCENEVCFKKNVKTWNIQNLPVT